MGITRPKRREQDIVSFVDRGLVGLDVVRRLGHAGFEGPEPRLDGLLDLSSFEPAPFERRVEVREDPLRAGRAGENPPTRGLPGTEGTQSECVTPPSKDMCPTNPCGDTALLRQWAAIEPPFVLR